MRRLRLMTTEKCSYRSSVSDAPSNSKSSTSSAFRVDRGQIDRELLAEERRVVAAAVAIVGGDRLRLGDELCRLGARRSSGHPVLRGRGEARGIEAQRDVHCQGYGQAGAPPRRAGLTMLGCAASTTGRGASGRRRIARPARTSASSFFTTSARTA